MLSANLVVGSEGEQHERMSLGWLTLNSTVWYQSKDMREGNVDIDSRRDGGTS